MKVTLTRRGFKGWLEGQPPRTIVGRPRSSCDCPIARYLLRRGVPTVSVGRWVVGWISAGGGRWNLLPMPSWAMEFVKRTDQLKDKTVKGVTARESLKILETI